MRVPTNDGLPLRTPGVLLISDKWLMGKDYDCLPVGAAANDGRLAGTLRPAESGVVMIAAFCDLSGLNPGIRHQIRTDVPHPTPT